MTSNGKMLLIMGPSGVGKTEVIRELRSKDPRFEYVCPYTTRLLRPGEADKISVSGNRFQQMARDGAFVAVNYLYGASYGTPKNAIEQSFAIGNFPVLDWPIDEAAGITKRLGGRVHRVYLSPPSLAVLHERLSDGRDPFGERAGAATAELDAVAAGQYDDVIDQSVTSTTGHIGSVAQEIYAGYIMALTATPCNPLKMEPTPARRIKLKNDRHRQVRGGRARLIEVVCLGCGEPVLLYQKDGRGHLCRCYTNRIFAPADLAAIHTDSSVRMPAQLPTLSCRVCGMVIGTPMKHTDGRLAFRLVHGNFRPQTARVELAAEDEGAGVGGIAGNEDET
jgi:guanylate kinase